MLTVLGMGMLLALTPVQQGDTVFAVNPRARLDLNAFGGEVVIRAWDRNEMRVRADLSSRDRLEITTSNTVVQVRARSARGVPRSVDYDIMMPATMDIEIGGTNLDVTATGVGGTVKVETVQGDVHVTGGTRFITLNTVSGDITLTGARGRMNVTSVNGDVDVRDAQGELLVETVNGDITLHRVQSDLVEGSTTNGDIDYDGTIRNSGRYWFNTHNGDITVWVDGSVNATVSVSTFNGEFDSDFPVTLTETRRGGKRFSFTLGNGSARVELDSFGGTIRLARPGGRRR